MVEKRKDISYALVDRKGPPWWAMVALLLMLFMPVAFRVALLGYEPPKGWNDALIAMVVMTAIFLFLFWLGYVSSAQRVEIRGDGLLVVVPLRRVIPFAVIQSVRRVTHSTPVGQFGWSTFLHRKLIPAWEKPPNVEIRFKEPVRLNLYPFKWFRMLLLTIEQPDKFMEELSREVDDVPRA